MPYTPLMLDDSIADWLKTGSVNFFGLPFSGKDNQARRLQQRLGGAVLGGGDILRNSTIPPEIRAIMNSGTLIPSDAYASIVLPYLSKPEFAHGPLFLSSVGRWQGEEDGVMKALDDSGHPLRAVIHLMISEEEVIRRFDSDTHKENRGIREDDEKEVLLKRLKEFRVKTVPVIEYYRQAGLLIEIDANKTKDEIELAVQRALFNRASTSP